MRQAQRKPYVALEHEFEPQHGLPERLPGGERILWQGAPRWTVLARRAFHADKVALYFSLLIVWRLAVLLHDGAPTGAVLRALGGWLLMAGLGLGLLLVLAWMSARSTVYTLTDRRIVMRIGIVLTVTYNLPLARIDRADLRSIGRAGYGDIALALEPGTRIAWLHLWPHARPWRLASPQPMLRALADVRAVSDTLAEAWSRACGQVAQPAAMPAPAAPPAAPAGVRQPAFASR